MDMIVVKVTQENRVATEAHMVGVEVQEDFREIITKVDLERQVHMPEGPAVTMAEEEEDTAKQGRREPAPKVGMEEAA